MKSDPAKSDQCPSFPEISFKGAIFTTALKCKILLATFQIKSLLGLTDQGTSSLITQLGIGHQCPI